MLKAIIAVALFVAVSAFAADPWQSVDATLQQQGKAVAGDDMVMGDLVLLSTEVERVVSALQAGGFEIGAIHNHLSGESPTIGYVHYAGHGDPPSLARTLRDALVTTATPMKPGAPAATSSLDDTAFKTISDVLQRKGMLNGLVLQFSIPRADAITENGMTIPPSMGVATAVNFQTTGDDVATTGDFVLVADEVNPVVRELQAHGIRATALHSHMLRESPRLFFLHFWGVGKPRSVAEGIQAALTKVDVAR